MQVKTSVTVTVNKKTPVSNTELLAPPAAAAVAPSAVGQTHEAEGAVKVPKQRKEKRPKKNLRYAGGAVWEDTTLNEWDPGEFSSPLFSLLIHDLY